MLIRALLALFLLCVVSTAEARLRGGSPAVDLFASPTGSGTACSLASPCSITQLQTSMQTALAASQCPAGYLRDGTYRINSTLTFGSADSGNAGCTVLWSSYASEVAHISGGAQVGGWTVCTATDGVCNGALTVYQATVTSPSDFREAYFGGTHGTRAAGGTFPGGWSVTSGGTYTAPVNSVTPTSSWTNPTEIEIVSQQGWMTTYCKISSIVSTTINMQTPCNTNWTKAFYPQIFVGVNTPAWIENAYELLQTCGKGCWYYNKNTQVLYYIPRDGENMASLDVEVPAVFQLVTGSGAHHLNFSRIVFEYSTWLDPDTSGHGYVEMQNGYYCPSPAPANCKQDNATVGNSLPGGVDFSSSSHHLTFSHDTFQHIATRGLFLRHSTQDSLVYANIFTDSGGGGWQVGDQSDWAETDASLKTARNTIKDNQCELSTAFEYRAAGCGLAPICDTCTISHNYANGSYWAAFTTGWWGWVSGNHITYNANNAVSNNHSYLSCAIWPMEDCGDFYNNGNQTGLVVSNNYAQGLGGNATNFKISCFYPDEGSSDVTTGSNVCDGPLTANDCNFLAPKGGCWYFARWSGGAVGGPVTVVAPNYATSSNFVDNGPGDIYVAPTTFTSGSPPSGAQTIIDNAGIEAGVVPGP